MNKSDILIIGSGLAGLFAACVAAKQGKSVQVLTYGGGTLKVGGGTIEVLGYNENGNPVKNPLAEIAALPAEHPYRKIGKDTAAKALAEFKVITAAMGYPHLGSSEQNQWIPTALGNFKPSCLVPQTMDTAALFKAKHVLVVDFYGMKDFYAPLAAENLRQRLAKDVSVDTFTLHLPLAIDYSLRDTSALDIARFLDTADGRSEFTAQLKPQLKAGTVVVLPPVLGTTADYTVLSELKQALACNFVEVASLPPAVTGIRLEKMLTDFAKQHGVRFIGKAKVNGAQIADGKCLAVYTEGFDRQRRFCADKFILATGGTYGGGLIAGVGTMTEPIFNIPVTVPQNQLEWSHKQLFDALQQPFSKFGVSTDTDLVPLKADGTKVADNVKVVGKSLSGYDFCSEKSGNGVALITAYKAAMDFCREDL